MKRLRHLFFPLLFETGDACKKLRIHNLRELETITNFNTWMFNVEDLLTLPKLQYLVSNVDGSLEDIECIARRMMMNPDDGGSLCTAMDISDFDCYTEKRHSVFRKLLACQSLKVLCFDGHLRLMPIHDMFSQNLTKIKFIGSELIEDPMEKLEKLPNLCELSLDATFVGKEMVCSESGFAELRIMQLLNLPYVDKWTVEVGAMPNISSLAIGNCAKLEMLPEGLKSVSGLPEGIGAAIHLRYLSFKDCVMRELPASIGNLTFLYILDLQIEQWTSLIIPNVLWKIRRLRHLFFPLLFETNNVSEKLRVDGLAEVETITNFNAWRFNVEDLLGLPKLQYLASSVDGSLEEIRSVVSRMMMNPGDEQLILHIPGHQKL